MIHHQALKLVKCLCEEVVKIDYPNAAEIFTEPLRNATCLGIHEIVEEILGSFPSRIHLRSEKNQSLFHLAIVYRREKVFNLVYQMEEDRRAFLSIPDASTNNALHSAGNLALQTVTLASSKCCWCDSTDAARKVHTAPSQRTHERRWKNPPRSIHRDKQGLGQRRRVVDERHRHFLHYHGGLDHDGGICGYHTVPRGTNSDNGLPFFLEDRAFSLFGISDTLALFSSSASLLMFLSIALWGTRFFVFLTQEIDYWASDSIPLHYIHDGCIWCDIKNCVWGTRAWIVIPVAVLSSVPVTLFVLLQFPLLLDMIKSTYYPGIFRKQSNRILH
ncbi:hypothetical protein Vadar_034468 [Vaccinium darrowii]|uniref:Uncharacterized protein n=1 Tax=Vaccinium darrowii TaxID=229202 RepID=A0ACB7ZPV8_9ERIC|nr:hypothetical protein Vadar_034468 [Vaccinium darrowii]